jgi:hypothetical protein
VRDGRIQNETSLEDFMQLHYRKSSVRTALMAFSCVVSLSIQACADEQSPLTSYNAAIGESSISGISSGAFMAVQFGTACHAGGIGFESHLSRHSFQ